MPSDSRTYKSIKNAQVNIFFYLMQIILGFWSRKVFYDYLGSEVLGLDTTAMSLLEFLNIAESGVGAAVAFFLYTPFFENDTKTINKIVALQGWIYRRIATFILVLGIILMCFFPWIFSDIKVPLWYAYATFSVLLFGNLLGYYVNYKQSVLSADQKTYKVVKVTQFSGIAFKAFLILWLPYASYPFLWYIGTTFLGYIIGSVWLNHVLKREYPWLSSVKESGRQLMKEYPEVLRKTKQLFIHRIAGFVIFQCSPLIMYAFSSLTVIAYYGNYLAVIGKVQDMLNQIFSSTQASVGNLVASKDKERMIKVLWELIDSRMCMSLILLFTLMMITEPFISVWLSPNYLLGKPLLFLVLLNAFLFINRSTIDSYKDAFGLFADVWAPFAECVINLTVSIVCGYFYGIEGVLIGNIVNLILIVFIWKPFYLFRHGFEMGCVKNFYLPYVRRIILLALSSYFLYYICRLFTPDIHDFQELIVFSIEIIVVATLYYLILFTLFTNGMKEFNQRILSIIRR